MSDQMDDGLIQPNYGRIRMGAVGGGITAAAIGVGSRLLGLPEDAKAADVLAIGITISTILLVPVSIYAAAVGSMFPAFNRATPVLLVRDSPAAMSLTWVSATLAFGLATLVLGIMMPMTTITEAVLGVFLAIAIAAALMLLHTSIRILDPVGLAEWITERARVDKRWRALRPPSRTLQQQAWGDLCRLTRGYNDARRVEAAARVLGLQAEFFSQHHQKMSAESVQLAARVLGECQAAANPTLDLAIRRFQAATSITPDPNARARKLRELRLMVAPGRLISP